VKIQSILGHVADIKFVYFHPEDVVRHRLVRDIIRAFDDYHARMNGQSDDGVGESLEPGEAPEGSAEADPSAHRDAPPSGGGPASGASA
jgi:hypothetical protein